MSNIIVGDVGTTLSITVSDQDGIVDLSSAQEVKFRMKKQGQYIEKIATIEDSVNGICKIVLDSTFTDKQGNFSYQVTIRFFDGSVFSSEKMYLSISEKL